MKELKAKRVPPGDRWALTSTEDDKIYSSLTEVLKKYFEDDGYVREDKGLLNG